MRSIRLYRLIWLANLLCMAHQHPTGCTSTPSPVGIFLSCFDTVGILASQLALLTQAVAEILFPSTPTIWLMPSPEILLQAAILPTTSALIVLRPSYDSEPFMQASNKGEQDQSVMFLFVHFNPSNNILMIIRHRQQPDAPPLPTLNSTLLLITFSSKI